jgi:hypothetical protein
VTRGETPEYIFPDSLDVSGCHVYRRRHKVCFCMIKRFITWLYARYVIIPAAKAAIRSFEGLNEDDFEITFTPDEELEAIIEAMGETKH